jgi:hypothetical protein
VLAKQQTPRERFDSNGVGAVFCRKLAAAFVRVSENASDRTFNTAFPRARAQLQQTRQKPVNSAIKFCIVTRN